MKLYETIEKFLEERTSDKTKESYRKKIESFYEFLINEKRISDDTYVNYYAGIDICVIKEALEYYIVKQNIQSKSAAYHFKSVIRMYFIYLHYKGVSADKLLKSFSILKGKDSYNEKLNDIIDKDCRLKEKNNLDILSEEEALDIIEQCDNNIANLIEENQFFTYKKRADAYTNLLGNIIIKLIMFTGIKYSSIHEIKVEDYNLDINVIKINGYSISLPHKLALQIKKYIEVRKYFENDSNALFINQKGEPISYTTSLVSGILSNFLDGKLKITLLIKYAITQMIKADVNKEVIKAFTQNSEDVYMPCFRAVYENDSAFKDRYLDSKLRSMEWYDEL